MRITSRGRSIIFGLAACSIAFSASPADRPTLPRTETDQMVRMITDCAGFYAWMEEFQRSTNQPAAADYTHTLGNGATFAAAYTMMIQRRAEDPNADMRDGKYWTDLVSGRAEPSRLRMRALSEAGDIESIKQQGQLCVEISETIEGILNLARHPPTSPPNGK